MSLAEEFSKKYKKPEKYKIIPDTKVIDTFGLEIDLTSSRLKTATLFGKPKQKLYDIICPIDVSSWNYESSNKTLLLRDDEMGFGIRIHGMFFPTIHDHLPKRGDILGKAGKYLPCGACVPIEGVILRQEFKDVLERRFGASEEKIDLGYIRSLADASERRYIDVKSQFSRQLRHKYRVEELNPYWMSFRPYPRAPLENIFNYLALFN